MENQSNQHKKYWQMVRRLAWEAAWQRSGMKQVIPSLALFLVTIGLAGLAVLLGIVPLPFFEGNATYTAMGGIALMLISLGSLVYLYNRLLSDIPPKLHYDQKTRITQLEAEIERLQEVAKPKPEPITNSLDSLKLVAIPDCSSNSQGWLTFQLHNQSKTNTQECYAELMGATKTDTPNYEVNPPQWLRWGSDHKERDGRKDIIAGNHFRVDVAAPLRGQFGFQTQNGRYYGSPGTYRVSIIIHGIYSTISFEYPFNLDFTYETINGFRCEKNGQEIVLTNPLTRGSA